jgi:putative heme iron utilization protein
MIIATAFLTLFAGTIMAEEKTTEQRAIEFVQSQNMGICASMMKGQPFLSIIPYSVDNGVPVIFISDLAQHTKNLNADGTASFLVMKEDKEDVYNSSRITFQGKMVKVTDDKEVKRIAENHIKKYPQAKFYYENLGDFNFYRMEITSIQFIGGFGDINWYEDDVEDYLKAAQKK